MPTFDRTVFHEELLKRFPRMRIQRHGGALLSGPPEWKTRRAGEYIKKPKKRRRRKKVPTTPRVVNRGYSTGLKPREKPTPSAPVFVSRPDPRVRRAYEEMYRKTKRRKVPATYTDLYLSPPGDTDEDREKFRGKVFQDLLFNEPFTDLQGKHYPSVWNYYESRVKQYQRSNDNDFVDDIASHVLERSLSLWRSGNVGEGKGQLKPWVIGAVSTDARREQLREQIESRHPGWKDSAAGQDMIEAEIRRRLKTTRFKPGSRQQLTSNLAVWLSNRLKNDLQSDYQRRKAQGLPGNLTERERNSLALSRAERTAQRDRLRLAMESLDAERLNADWLISEDGERFLQQVPVEDRGSIAMLAAIGRGTPRSRNLRRALARMVENSLPAAIKVEVVDDDGKKHPVEVDPSEAVLSGDIYDVTPGGRKINYPSMSLKQSIVLIGRANGFDDDALVEMLNNLPGTHSSPSAVRVMHSRALRTLQTRLNALASAKLANRRLELPDPEVGFKDWLRLRSRTADEQREWLEQVFTALEARQGMGVSADLLRRWREGKASLDEIVRLSRDR